MRKKTKKKKNRQQKSYDKQLLLRVCSEVRSGML